MGRADSGRSYRVKSEKSYKRKKAAEKSAAFFHFLAAKPGTGQWNAQIQDDRWLSALE
jgi:hypothetical protein